MLSIDLKQRRVKLENEHKFYMVKIMNELNQKIIDFNTDLGKYFLINHLIENSSGNLEIIESLKTMKYKESRSGNGVDKNEYEMAQSSYSSKSIIFENNQGKKLKFRKLIEGWDTSLIDVELDGVKIDFDWKIMNSNIDNFIMFSKKQIEDNTVGLFL